MKQSTFHKKFTTWFNMLLTRNRVIFKFTLKTLPYSCQYKTPINLQMTENLWWLSMIDLEAVSEEMVFRKFYASSIQTKPFNYRKIASIKKYKRMWLTTWGIVSVSLKKKKNAKKAIKVILTLDNFINRTLLSHYKGSLMAVTECWCSLY